MRVLLSTWGSRGDVEPVVALAVQLQARGAETKVCAPPDFEDLLARVGVPMVPTGLSVRGAVHGTSGEKPVTPADAPRVAAAIVESQFEQVAPAAQDCDAVVATGLMPAGVRTIAETLGIPYMCVAFMPGTLPSAHRAPLPRPGRPFPPDADIPTMWEVDAERVQVLYGPPLNARRAALGLPPVDNVRDHVHTDRPWLAADPTLAPADADVDVVQTGAWILPDERPLPDDVLAFLDAGAPPVFIGSGSVRVPGDYARVAIDAVRAQGRRVLLARGWADLELIDDRDDCFAVGEVSYQALFPRVAAVVHHGGAGTTTTAARAGAAQVIVPQIADQFYWADRGAALGIGAAHDGSTPTVDSLSAALRVALAPETRMRATATAGKIRTDGTAVAADLLFEAVRRNDRAPAGSAAPAHR